MGILAPASTVNIYQTVLSTLFTEKQFIITSGSQKIYDLEYEVTPETDVVLLNGLYQVRGSEGSYTQQGSTIVFNDSTILTPGDDLVVYFEKKV